MAEYLTLFIGAVVVNNFVLTKFLGLCIFFGISTPYFCSMMKPTPPLPDWLLMRITSPSYSRPTSFGSI